MAKNNRPLINNKPVSLRLPGELHAVIAKAAEAEQRSVSNYIVRLLTAHAEQLKTTTTKGRR